MRAVLRKNGKKSAGRKREYIFALFQPRRLSARARARAEFRLQRVDARCGGMRVDKSTHFLNLRIPWILLKSPRITVNPSSSGSRRSFFRLSRLLSPPCSPCARARPRGFHFFPFFFKSLTFPKARDPIYLFSAARADNTRNKFPRGAEYTGARV